MNLKIVHEEMKKLYSRVAKKLDNPVNSAECNKFLQMLDDLALPETFYWTFNIKTQQLAHFKNVYDHLGYHELSLYDSLRILHQDQLKVIFRKSSHIYEVYQDCNFLYNQLAFRSILALKNAQDNFVVVKHLAIPFEMDSNGRLISHLSHFTVLKDYDGEPFQLKIIKTLKFLNHIRAPMYDGILMNGTPLRIEKNAKTSKLLNISKLNLDMQNLELPDEDLPFSKPLLKVLQLKAQNNQLTNKEIAKELGLKVNTILDYNKKILKEFRHQYPGKNHLKTMGEIALLLKEVGYFKG